MPDEGGKVAGGAQAAHAEVAGGEDGGTGDMRKLTDRQAELLAAIRGGVVVDYVQFPHFDPTPFYWRADTYKKCTREATALLKRGLVKKCNESGRGHELKAT
jgi:hypothetical protein